MKDISKTLGLAGRLDIQTGRIEFDVQSELEIFRTLQDLGDLGVLADLDSISSELLAKPLTYIYRMLNDEAVRQLQNVAPQSDDGVKFDVTSLVPYSNLSSDWGFEYPKTSGHYHTALPGSKYASPDFYQVVSGHGAIMLQQQVGDKVAAKVVFVNEGDTLLIAPELGHTSINLGEEAFVFSNVCVRRPHLNYDDIHRFGGAPYFVRRDAGSGDPIFAENKAYSDLGLTVSDLEIVEPDWNVMQGLGIAPSVPIYDFIASPVVTDMLCHPDAKHSELTSALRASI